eukprot:274847-Amphidinium_carterae.1
MEDLWIGKPGHHPPNCPTSIRNKAMAKAVMKQHYRRQRKNCNVHAWTPASSLAERASQTSLVLMAQRLQT